MVCGKRPDSSLGGFAGQIARYADWPAKEDEEVVVVVEEVVVEEEEDKEDERRRHSPQIIFIVLG